MAETSSPRDHHSQQQRADGWHSGLFECNKDFSNCCVTCWAPYLTFGHTAEILDAGGKSCLTNALYYVGAACVGCPWAYAARYRTKLRLKLGLQPSPCNDVAVHFFCGYCALCQEHRELKAKGIDPALGWEANSQKYTHLSAPQTHAMHK
ncbi:hypothetical protein KP509_06G054200 [Ceratopteris richardii]|uniref:Uncharacterized protein n=1 Tax=Ceratopteris richardii TaxID=49495 RepID=A0A8T2UKV6_CERRI|nr:hypothetical protein KP509_06G054200 [Ceratopteris richardii]